MKDREEYINILEQDNAKLKKQLEEINKMIEKCGFVNIEQVMLNYCGLLTQQKEFIKWLKDNIDNLREIISDNRIENNISHLNYLIYKNNLYTEILKKYKEIIGGKDAIK